MSAIVDAIDALAVQVAENTKVEASAVELIKGLAEQIGKAAGDPAKVKELADKLKVSAEALAAAVVNTPVEPVPVDPPDPAAA